MKVHGTRDVGAVEEISANYLDDVEAILDWEGWCQRLESAWGFGSIFIACDASTPFGIASERRTMEEWRLMEDYQNKQEHVDAMENAFGRINSPGTTVNFGDIEQREERLEQKRRDMMNVVQEPEWLLDTELARVNFIPILYKPSIHLAELTRKDQVPRSRNAEWRDRQLWKSARVDCHDHSLALCFWREGS